MRGFGQRAVAADSGRAVGDDEGMVMAVVCEGTKRDLFGGCVGGGGGRGGGEGAMK